MSFEGQAVWITGASSGIGAALAHEWASRGAAVILSGRDRDRLENVAKDCGETLILTYDVRDEAALTEATAKALAWKGGVDVAVANAGVSQRSPALKTTMQVYRDIIDIDLTAQIAFAQGLIRPMAERAKNDNKLGALAFISSVAGKVGVPMRTAYCAAKFGLAGYADALRSELSQSGISVHTIFPGSIATNISRNALTADGSRRGQSDKAIEQGIRPEAAAKTMVDAIEAGQREIIVAQGSELAMAELRRTPDQLFDQVASLVASGYMERMETED